MDLQKQKPDKDRQYLKFIRTQKCCVGELFFHDISYHCSGEIEAHHTETGGMAMKGSDYSTIPLCTRHHKEAHDRGKVTFYVHYGLDRFEIMFNSLREYIRCYLDIK